MTGIQALTYLFIGGFLLCLSWWSSLMLRRPRLPREHWLPVAILPVLVVVLACGYLAQLLAQLQLTNKTAWDGCRLVPTIALKYGYTLYYGPDQGPILNTIYGPVTALAYLPAALAGNPTWALLIGGCVNLLLVLPPILAWHLQVGRSESGQCLTALAGFIFAAATLLSYPPTHYNVFRIHADAPALGLGLLSCLVLFGDGQSSPRMKRLALAALLAVSACWAKQTSAPLIVAQWTYLWLGASRKTAFQYAGLALGLGILEGVVLGAGLGGLRPMAFNMFSIPGHHPSWAASGRLTIEQLQQYGLTLQGIIYDVFINYSYLFAVLLQAAWQTVEPRLPAGRRLRMLASWSGWLFVAIFTALRVRYDIGFFREQKQPGIPPVVIVNYFFLAVLLAQVRVGWLASLRRQGEEWPAWLRRQPWVLPGLAAICMLPMSIYARRKTGGDVNNFSFLFYLVVSVSLILCRPESSDLVPAKRRAHAFVPPLLALLMVVSSFNPRLTRFDLLRHQIASNYHQRIYDYAKAHPNQGYYPWGTLSILLAEGRLYHFEYGVLDRALAGFAPTSEHFHAGIPPKAARVVAPWPVETLEFMPEFSSEPGSLPGLPGQLAYPLRAR